MKHKILIIVYMIAAIIIVILCFNKECSYNLDTGDGYNVETKEEDIDKSKEHSGKVKGELKISNGDENKENKLINILLLGIDKQENASDTIMILSINREKQTIKLVSIMRDTYVYQGEGLANKINYAYHYGGIQGSINTINNIFNLDITKFVKVNFDDLINIVNYLGGVEVNINEAERKEINISCKENPINNCGNVTLNGEQALAFSRIREIDSDFERTERQRKVILGAYHKIKNTDISKYPKTIYTLSNYAETNLSIIEMLKIGNIILKYNDSNFSEFRIPMDGTSSDSTNGVYHLNWDIEVNKSSLYDFLYN